MVSILRDSFFNYRGSDIRTLFAGIGDLRALTNAPVMTLTASAPPRGGGVSKIITLAED